MSCFGWGCSCSSIRPWCCICTRNELPILPVSTSLTIFSLCYLNSSIIISNVWKFYVSIFNCYMISSNYFSDVGFLLSIKSPLFANKLHAKYLSVKFYLMPWKLLLKYIAYFPDFHVCMCFSQSFYSISWWNIFGVNLLVYSLFAIWFPNMPENHLAFLHYSDSYFLHVLKN